MRLLSLLCFFTACAMAADLPADLATHRTALEADLKTFRFESPKGWSFTQTTVGDGHSRIERYDAAQPDFNRWTLLQEDGHSPTPDEAKDYAEKLSRRSRGGTAPRLAEQLDLGTLTIAAENPDRITYQLRLKPGEKGDATAKFLVATLVIHKPTRMIESFELASMEAFSPTFGVSIASMKTTMTYSLPEENRPGFLLKSVTHLRGRAFWLKSLDADMTVTFTDYERAHK